MAIPNRTTIACPVCNTAQDVTIADSSIGPGGRISASPILSMFPSPLWRQTRRNGETWLSCTTCGAAEFITLAAQAKRGQIPAPPPGKPARKQARTT